MLILKPEILLQMEDRKYKVVIIGAGISGLSTGLSCLKTSASPDDRILIVEKQPVPGGCIATYAREGYRFDTVQIIPDVSDLLSFFGIETEMVTFGRNYARLFIAKTKTKTATVFPILSGIREFEDFLRSSFPEDESAIKRFFRYSVSMHAELKHLKTEPRFYEFPGILMRCPKIIANSGKTYKEYLERFRFKNHELKEILNTFSTFSGLSANRCAALLTVGAMITTLKGSYRTRKGFIEFPQLLRKAFVERGGQLMLNTSVQCT